MGGRRVVDQDVDPAEGADGGLDHRLDLLRVRHVAGDSERLVPLLAEHRRGVVRAAQIGDHHARALPGGGAGDRLADAAGTAGDDDGQIVQFAFHGAPSRGRR